MMIVGSLWDIYDACPICAVEAGSPCLDLKRKGIGRLAHPKKVPHRERPEGRPT